MNIHGCFIVFGQSREPEVQLLTDSRHKLFNDRLRVARTEHGRGRALAVTFGTGVEYALPAWSVECLTEIAEHYTGPHQVRLRGLCAAIALGQPYGPDAEGKPKDGGAKVPRRPIKPRPSGPVKLAQPAPDFYANMGAAQ